MLIYLFIYLFIYLLFFFNCIFYDGKYGICIHFSCIIWCRGLQYFTYTIYLYYHPFFFIYNQCVLVYSIINLSSITFLPAFAYNHSAWCLSSNSTTQSSTAQCYRLACFDKASHWRVDLMYRATLPPFIWCLSLLYKLYPGNENSAK